MFKVGDTVRVYNSKGQDSGIVSKILKIDQSSISGETVYGLENGYQYPERWLKLEKENNMFEVGDLVKYKGGEVIYEINSITSRLKLRHLKSGRIYNEGDGNKLVKLKFKIGDKVRIVAEGAYKNIVTTVTGASISSASGNLYYDTKSCNIGFMEHLLELVTDAPEFKKGDLVYVDSTKINSIHCHKVFQVVEIHNNKHISCCGTDLKTYVFEERVLSKFKFQPKDIVQVINEKNLYFGAICIVDKISFLDKTIHYNLNSAVGSFREDELAEVSEYNRCSKIASGLTVKSTDTAIKIPDCEIVIDKSIYDSLEEQVSEIIDTYINNNLNNQKNDENRLQEEGTLESGRDQQERVGIHGRRHQVAIRVRYQCHEARPRKGGSPSIRVKDQLSTSYRRTYGSKD